LAEYLNSALSLSARHLDISEIVDCDTPLSESQQANCLSAIGAALRQESTAL